MDNRKQFLRKMLGLGVAPVMLASVPESKISKPTLPSRDRRLYATTSTVYNPLTDQAYNEKPEFYGLPVTAIHIETSREARTLTWRFTFWDESFPLSPEGAEIEVVARETRIMMSFSESHPDPYTDLGVKLAFSKAKR